MGRNPDVWLDWTQRGHTVYDPTGQELHPGRAVWRRGISKGRAKKEARRAKAYARRQKDWVDYRVTVKNPRRRRRNPVLKRGKRYRLYGKGPYVQTELYRFDADEHGLAPYAVWETSEETRGRHHPRYYYTRDAAEKEFRKMARNPRRRRRNWDPKWGRTEFSTGPLKSPAQVRALAKKLKRKRAPYAQEAGRFADRYTDTILAQPEIQREMIDVERRYRNPREWITGTTFGDFAKAEKAARRLSLQHGVGHGVVRKKTGYEVNEYRALTPKRKILVMYDKHGKWTHRKRGAWNPGKKRRRKVRRARDSKGRFIKTRRKRAKRRNPKSYRRPKRARARRQKKGGRREGGKYRRRDSKGRFMKAKRRKKRR